MDETYNNLPQRGCNGCRARKAIWCRKIRYYVNYIETHMSNEVLKVVFLASLSNVKLNFYE